MTPSAFRALPGSDQDEMIAYVQDICPDCGNLRNVCSDPKRDWYAQRTMCYATAAREQLVRTLQKQHGDPDGGKPHPLDGLTSWVSDQDLNPDDTSWI